jgi:hypothetical protein
MAVYAIQRLWHRKADRREREEEGDDYDGLAVYHTVTTGGRKRMVTQASF